MVVFPDPETLIATMIMAESSLVSNNASYDRHSSDLRSKYEPFHG
jgi:hypothetical protein